MYKITEEQRLKLKNTMALLSSIINGGEQHSNQSKERFKEALDIVNNIPIYSVISSFTADEVIKELEACETLDDAIMFFK